MLCRLTDLETVAGAQQTHQCRIGFLVVEQLRKALVHRQGFQTEIQPLLVSQDLKTVAFPVTGQGAVCLFHGISI